MKTKKERKEDYLKRQGLLCPYCGDNDLEPTSGHHYSEMTIEEEMECLACNKKWTDQYTLTDVEFEDE